MAEPPDEQAASPQPLRQGNFLFTIFPSICTLETWVQRIMEHGKASLKARLPDLIHDDDHQEYLQLLRDTLVVTITEGTGRALDYYRRQNMPDIVHRVVEIMLQGSGTGRGRGGNILTLGYRTRSTDGDHGMARGGPIQCDFPNSSVNHLLTPKWATLLQRVGFNLKAHRWSHGDTWYGMAIGDECIWSLINDHLIFLKLLNGSYMQLCGPPLSVLLHDDPQLGERYRAHVLLRDQRIEQPSVHGSKTGKSRGNHPSNPGTISRRHMLYCNEFNPRPGLPRGSPLTRLGSGTPQARAIRLARFIFKAPSNGSKSITKNRTDLPKRVKQAIPLLVELLDNLREYDFALFLGRYCSIANPPHPNEPRMGRKRKRKRTPDDGDGGSKDDDGVISWHLLDLGYHSQEEEEEEEDPRDWQQPQPLLGTHVNRPNLLRHIGIEGQEKGLEGSKEEDEKEDLLEGILDKASSHDQVYAFLRHACQSIIPLGLWGSLHNRRTFERNLKDFVGGSHHEVLSVRQCLNGMRTKDLKWMDLPTSSGEVGKHKHKLPPSDLTKREEHLGQLIFFIFTSFVIPLVRAFFYVTEADGTGQTLWYFRMPVWKRLQSRALQDFFAKQYTIVDTTIEPVPRLGITMIRLLPKKKGGIRILTNFSGPPASNSLQLRPRGNKKRQASAPTEPARQRRRLIPVNRVLGQAHQVLKYEYLLRPELVGFGVFGLDDVTKRLQEFVKQVRCTCREGVWQCPPLYFASVDIERCYDNIDVDRLLTVLQDVITEEHYLVTKSVVMHPHSRQKVFTKPIREAFPDGGFRPFSEVALELSKEYTGSVMANTAAPSQVSKKEVLALITEHLRNNLVYITGGNPDMKVDATVFKQTLGISQGSSLSAILCNLYYGALEKAGLFLPLGPLPSPKSHPVGDISLQPSIPLSSSSSAASGATTIATCLSSVCPRAPRQTISLLVRLMDDYLFISTSLQTAKRFVDICYNELPKHGARVKHTKSLANFDHAVGDLTIARVQEQPEFGTALFPWCGMILNTRDCQCSADYSRLFPQGINPEASIVDHVQHPGHTLRLNMKGFLKPKCHPVILDSSINKLDTVYRNIYEMFLVCAIRSYHSVRSLPRGLSGNVDFFLHCINETVSYCYSLIQRRTTRRFRPIGVDRGRSQCYARRAKVTFLGLRAFLVVTHLQQRYRVNSQDRAAYDCVRQALVDRLKGYAASGARLIHIVGKNSLSHQRLLGKHGHAK